MMRKSASLRLARMLGSSGVALATGIGWGGSAQAQNAFQGTPTLQSGSATFGGTAGQDTITVASDQAVIDWAPTDTGVGGGDINFLPAGNTALFKNDATLANSFTVLNRVLPVDPTRRVALNGTIQARFEDMVSGTLTPGGNVWFYAPGGILVGSSAVIDVGGLTLTTADPVRDGSGNFIAAGQTVYQPSASNRDVTVVPGASITATPENSYLTMIAPIVRQGGAVNVNGSAALIAAEAATVTFNNGLFDIQVTQGTDGDPLASGAAITHTGSTAGPASSAAGDTHRVYMVAVPKNTAITLSIIGGGALGFDIAGAADVVGNAVILSAGHNVSGDAIAPAPVSPVAANIIVDNATVTSALTARASTNLNVNTFSGNSSFAGDVTVSAGVASRIDAQNGFTLTFARNVKISADNLALTADASDRTAGTAVFQSTNGATATVGGDLVISANATGGDNNSGTGRGGNATSGLAALYNTGGGTLTVGGNVFISSIATAGNGTGGSNGGDATSGMGFFSSQDGGVASINGSIGVVEKVDAFAGAGATGGTATAGGATVLTLNSGTMNIAASVDQSSNGAGGAGSAGAGGAGISGTASVSAQTGDMTINGNVVQNTKAFGGSAIAGTGGNASSSTVISTNVSTVAATLQIGGNVTIDATKVGGAGVSGGSATSSNISINTNNNGIVRVLGTGLTTLRADSIGGDATTGTGGSATGGNAQIFPGVGPTLGGGQAILAGSALISATATGGNSISGNGGVATGGRPKIQSQTDSITTVAGAVTLDGSATGGSTVSGTGGAGTAGATFLLTNNGATVGGVISLSGDATLLSVGRGGQATGTGTGGAGLGLQATIAPSDPGTSISITGNVMTDASGFGGDATSAAATGSTGEGGLAGVFASSGLLNVGGTFTALAQGTGGVAASGGTGTGGSAILSAGAATGSMTIQGATTLNASGIGANGLANNGGAGAGGFANILTNAAGGAITLNNNLTALAFATGGNGVGSGSGGNATGGMSRISAPNGNISVAGSIGLVATAQAGNGTTTSTSQGGSAIVQANGPGTMSLHSATLLTTATGGGNTTGSGTTGNAIGGTTQIVATANGSITVTGDANLTSAGAAVAGSIGTDGGNGQGGNSSISQGTGGQVTVTGNAIVSANGIGAANMNGGDGIGGTGTGGDSRIVVNDLTVTIGGLASAIANGTGGAGGTAGVAGSGGAGIGGLANLGSAIGTLAIGGNGQTAARGIGGSAGSSGAGGAGTGGSALIGTVTPTATINIANVASADASGTGGGAIGAGFAGGIGTGGTAQMFATGGTIRVQTGTASLTASGSGGTASGGASSGDGLGGFGEVTGFGGVVRIASDLSINAAAFAGQVTSGAGASGTATGGLARVSSPQATSLVDIGGGATVIAAATGGNLTGGAAGLATGGNAVITVGAGQISITGAGQTIARAQGSNNVGGSGGSATGGTAVINMSSTGGSSLAIGGNAVADARSIGGTAQGAGVNGGASIGGTSRLFAQGGTLTIGGGADLRSSAIGGSVLGSGNGGNAQSGPSTLSARNASVTISGTVATGIPGFPNAGIYLFAGASGGQGAGGGNGGNAVGSTQPGPGVEGGAQLVALNDANGPSSITAPSALLVVGAGGGAGGAGTAGGRGGDGTGGTTLALGSAGNGTLNLGPILISSQGTGGAGGAGTVQGGPGGNGQGGFNQFGTQSGTPTATDAGAANFGSINTLTAGIGGAGGSGGASGNGGNGGDGAGGTDVLLVRGSPVTAANVTMNASGNGGAGGTGVIAGSGGDGTAGSVNVTVTNRNLGTARGLLTVTGIVNGFSFPTAGLGSTVGQRIFGTGNSILIQNGDVNVGNISIGSAGTVPTAGSGPSFLRVVNGSLNSANNISFTTESEASVLVDTGSLTAGGLVTLGAANFVRDGVVTSPAAVGNISGSNLNIMSQGDTIVTANFASAGFFSVFAPGAIDIGNVTGGDEISLEAGGTIATGTLTALSDIDLDAGGAVTTGNIVTGDSLTVISAGTIAVGNVSAGIINPSTDPDAGYSIGLVASGNVQFGTLQALANIGLGSDTGTITGGSASAGESFLALARGNISLASISAGTGADDYLYFADSSMFPLGGTVDNFDPTPIFAVAPVKSSGGFSVSGNVSGGNIIGAAGSNISFGGSVTASQRLFLDTGGRASFGGQVSAPRIDITSNDIDLGASGRLGTSGTTVLNLIASGAVTFGGASGAGGYQIDASEASGISAQQIVLAAGSNDVEIRDVALTGSGSATANLAGTSGSLSISTSGTIRVRGAFTIDQMAPTNALSLQADKVTVATGTGRIVLSGNSPGGILSISANDVHIATQSILDRLATNVNFAGRNAALGVGTGQNTPTIQARQIDFTVRNSLLIQNNGNQVQFAGFNVYSGNLSITPSGATPLDMVVYGSLYDPATGTSFVDVGVRDMVLPDLTVSQFSAGSAINGCALTATACITFSSDSPSAAIANDIGSRSEGEDAQQEEKEREEKAEFIAEKAASTSPIQPPVSIIDSRPLVVQPVLDDPITGGGNTPIGDANTVVSPENRP